MQISIQLVTQQSEFLDQIASWYQTQWGEKYPERTLTDWKSRIATSKSIPATYSAIDQSTTPHRLIGTVALHKQGMKNSDPSSIWLTALYVNEPDRRQGIGTLLVKAAIEHARRNNITKLHLFTFSSGEIYTKLGWLITAETIINSKKTLIMERKVARLQYGTFFDPKNTNHTTQYQHSQHEPYQ